MRTGWEPTRHSSRRSYMKQALLAALILAFVAGCSSTDVSVKTIAELNDPATAAGTYQVTGFLVLLDDCGFCPPGAACEPCAGPGVSVLANSENRTIDWSPLAREIAGRLGADDLLLVINLENEGELQQGRQYRMTVQLTDDFPYGANARLAQLLDFSQPR